MFDAPRSIAASEKNTSPVERTATFSMPSTPVASVVAAPVARSIAYRSPSPSP